MQDARPSQNYNSRRARRPTPVLTLLVAFFFFPLVATETAVQEVRSSDSRKAGSSPGDAGAANGSRNASYS